jgi:hypothetical protein
MGNLKAGNQKMAPNLFYSEPFFRFGINFQIANAKPLTLLFIGGINFQIANAKPLTLLFIGSRHRIHTMIGRELHT